jgi:hypothetical protein
MKNTISHQIHEEPLSTKREREIKGRKKKKNTQSPSMQFKQKRRQSKQKLTGNTV